MFDYCYFDYYGKTRKLENEPKVVSEIELWIDDTNLLEAKIGTVFSEERKFEDFMVTEYSCSDGTSIKNKELSDGKRISESYDSVTGQYECNVFDNQGTLLIKDKCDRNGNYEIAERNSDGTLSTTSGTSIFIRCINGKVI